MPRAIRACLCARIAGDRTSSPLSLARKLRFLLASSAYGDIEGEHHAACDTGRERGQPPEGRKYWKQLRLQCSLAFR